MNNGTTSQRTQTSRDRAIERGVARALEQSRAGNVPSLLRKIERAHETQQLLDGWQPVKRRHGLQHRRDGQRSRHRGPAQLRRRR